MSHKQVSHPRHARSQPGQKVDKKDKAPKNDRGWGGAGAVGWGVLGAFGSLEKDTGAQVVRKNQESNIKMVKNEKGLWVKIKVDDRNDAGVGAGRGRGGGLPAMGAEDQQHGLEVSGGGLQHEAEEGRGRYSSEDENGRNEGQSRQGRGRRSRSRSSSRFSDYSRRKHHHRRRRSPSSSSSSVSSSSSSSSFARSRSRGHQHSRYHSRSRSRSRGRQRKRSGSRDERRRRRSPPERRRKRSRSRSRQHRDGRRKEGNDKKRIERDRIRSNSIESSRGEENQSKKPKEAPSPVQVEKQGEPHIQIVPPAPSPEEMIFTAAQLADRLIEVYNQSSSRRYDNIAECFVSDVTLSLLKTNAKVLSGAEELRDSMPGDYAKWQAKVTRRLFIHSDQEQDPTFSLDFYPAGHGPGINASGKGGVRLNTVLLYQVKSEPQSRISAIWIAPDREGLASSEETVTELSVLSTKTFQQVAALLKDRLKGKLNYTFHDYTQMETWG